MEMPEPAIPVCEPWDQMDLLARERDVIGVYISGHPLDKFRFEIKHLCSPDEGLEVLNQPLAWRGRELRFAGSVVEAQHRISKAGKPFGSVTIEDYHASQRFMLFGDDYLKFKDYLVEGWFVFVRGSVEQRRFRDDPNDVEFKVRHIELLADVREKWVSRLRLQLDLQALDEERLGRIGQMIEGNPGTVGLTVEVHDQGMALEMPSRSRKVTLNDAFVDELEQLTAAGGVQYRLETSKQ